MILKPVASIDGLLADWHTFVSRGLGGYLQLPLAHRFLSTLVQNALECQQYRISMNGFLGLRVGLLRLQGLWCRAGLQFLGILWLIGFGQNSLSFEASATLYDTFDWLLEIPTSADGSFADCQHMKGSDTGPLTIVVSSLASKPVIFDFRLIVLAGLTTLVACDGERSVIAIWVFCWLFLVREPLVLEVLVL